MKPGRARKSRRKRASRSWTISPRGGSPPRRRPGACAISRPPGSIEGSHAMDNWLIWDTIIRQAADERERWARTLDVLEVVAPERKGRLRARLAALLARGAMRLGPGGGRATPGGGPHH